MKVTKILAILLRVDCRLWSQVGYSGQKAKIFTIDVLLRVVCVEIPCIQIQVKYCHTVLRYSVGPPLVKKLSWSYTLIGLLRGLNSKFSTSILISFIWDSPKGGGGVRTPSPSLPMDRPLLNTVLYLHSNQLAWRCLNITGHNYFTCLTTDKTKFNLAIQLHDLH